MSASPWWKEKKGSAGLASAIWTRVTRMRALRKAENLRDLIHEAIYRGRPLGSAGDSFALASMASSRSAPAIINIARAKADAITSRMSKHRAFPVITAEDAGWSEKRFAKRVSSVLRGRLGQQAIERDKSLRVRDSIIRGTGVAKVIRTESTGADGKLRVDVGVERIPRSEILYGSREAQYGTPRNLFQVRSYPVEVLLAKYGKTPEAARAISNAAQRATYDDAGWYEWGDDWADESWQVPVTEAWHLPSGHGANDGRWVGTTKDHVLWDEVWKRPRFPFAWLHWSPPMRGVMGSGLIEDLSGVQAKINDVARDIQEALYYGAQLTIFSPRGAKISKEHLRKRHPKIVEYDGAIPTWVAPQPVSEQLFRFLDWLLNIADDLSGLSRDFQSGKTQLGAGASGRAIDTLDDIQSDRFAMFELHDSLHMVDIGMAMVDEARDIYADSKSDAAPWIKEHRWNKIDVDGGPYHLRLQAKNFLPDERAGKMAGISEAAAAGLIQDPTDALDLFDEPDMERMNRKLLGPRRAIARVMQDLAEPDVPLVDIQADSFFPLEAGIAEARAELNDAWANDADEIILQRFRDWITWAEAKSDSAAAASAPMPGPGVAPGMAPMPSGPGMPPAAAPPMAAPGMILQ